MHMRWNDGAAHQHGPRPGKEHLVRSSDFEPAPAAPVAEEPVLDEPVAAEPEVADAPAAPEPWEGPTDSDEPAAEPPPPAEDEESEPVAVEPEPEPGPDPAWNGGGSGGPLNGVFVGNEPSALARYENWLGQPAEAVLAYTGDRDWNDMDPGWVMSQFPGRTLLFSIPLFPQTSTLEEVANGAGDEHFRRIAEKIMTKADEVDAPDGSIYVRTGWEMGGEWFRWGQQGNDRPDLFIKAFQNFAEVFHGVSDRFKVVWDVTPDRGDTSKFYPGDEYVDVMSQDFYWSPEWTSQDPAVAWQIVRDGDYGPAWFQEFAASRGKPTAVTEWGVPAGYDATAWIEAVRDWFNDPSHNMAYHAFWDSDSNYPGMLSDGSDAASGAAYRDAFGM